MDSSETTLSQLLKICGSGQIAADTSSTDAFLAEDFLRPYHSVVFLGVSPDLLNYRQQNDLERYLQSMPE